MHENHAPASLPARLAPALLCLFAPVLAAQGPAKADAAKAVAGKAEVDFLKEVVPIFKARCFECHGPEKQEADIRFDKKAGLFVADQSSWVVKPGDAKKSEMIYRIELPADDEDVMPPEGGALKKAEIETIRRWIAQGAKWPDAADAAIAKMVTASKPKIETIELPELTDDQKAAESKAIEAIDKAGGLAMRVAANTTASEVNFSLLGGKATGDQIALIGDLRNTLVRLNLSRTKIDDAGLAAVGGMRHLRWLSLAKTAVGDAGVAHLKGLDELSYLNLYGTNVTDAGLKALHGMKKLKKVFVWQTKVTEAGAAALAKAIPGLKVDRGEYAKVLASIKPPEKKPAGPVAINKTCPVTGKPVADGKTVTFQGQVVGLCCDKCVKKFGDKPEQFIGKVAEFKVAKGDKAVNATCPVANKPVADGKVLAFRGEVIGFCCDKCKAKFGKNPDEFVGKLDVFKPPKSDAPKKGAPKKGGRKKGARKKTVKAATANQECPVSGKPVDVAQTSPYQGRTIGFCCAKCKKAFDADPKKYRAKLAGIFEK